MTRVGVETPDLLSISLYAIEMKKSIGLTIFLIILFVLLLVIAAGYYASKLPFLGTLANALIWVLVFVGIAAVAFIIVILIKTIKGDKE